MTTSRRLLVAASAAVLALPILDAGTAVAAPHSAGTFVKADVQNALEAPLEAQTGGFYTADIPSGLHLTRGSVTLQDAFDSFNEIDFLPATATHRNLVAGELIATDNQAPALVAALEAAGIPVSGEHTHLTNVTPRVQWIHFEVKGDAVVIATNLRHILDAVTSAHFPVTPGKKSTTLPASTLGADLGGEAQVMENGVVQVGVDRTDSFKLRGTTLPAGLDVGAMIFFEPLAHGLAATTGEAALRSNEVSAVVNTLRKEGFEVTALHNHFITLSRVLYYVHWWKTGAPTTLAVQLRTVLDRAAYKTS